MKKVLCIGNASYDISFLTEDYPTENKKYRIEEKIESGGGPASNAAYLLGKWNADVYFAGIVGNDTFGKTIESEFKSVNVNTDFLEFDDNNGTTLASIIINKKSGTRTVLAYRDPDIKYNKEINIKPDIILVDGQEYETSKKVIESNPEAISVIDAGRAVENVINLAKMVTYVVCSKDFAEGFTNLELNINDKNSIYKVYEIMEQNFNNVVITLEEKGTLYKKEGKLYIMPSIKTTQLDSTGAGDYFHGSFVYGLLNGFSIEKNIRMSNITGALSVMKVGARQSCPSLEEVVEKYNAK